MMKELTTTQTIVDEFKLAKTMIHRQIWGKKYPGGSQKLETYVNCKLQQGLWFRIGKEESRSCHNKEKCGNGKVG